MEFSGYDLAIDERRISNLYDLARGTSTSRKPTTRAVGRASSMTVDGLPILDWAQPYRNAYLATVRYSMLGMTVSGARGRRRWAEMIVTGSRPDVFEPLPCRPLPAHHLRVAPPLISPGLGSDPHRYQSATEPSSWNTRAGSSRTYGWRAAAASSTSTPIPARVGGNYMAVDDLERRVDDLVPPGNIGRITLIRKFGVEARVDVDDAVASGRGGCAAPSAPTPSRPSRQCASARRYRRGGRRRVERRAQARFANSSWNPASHEPLSRGNRDRECAGDLDQCVDVAGVGPTPLQKPWSVRRRGVPVANRHRRRRPPVQVDHHIDVGAADRVIRRPSALPPGATTPRPRAADSGGTARILAR